MSHLSDVGYAATQLPSMTIGIKVATRLRSCQDLPSPLKYASREKNVATRLRSAFRVSA